MTISIKQDYSYLFSSLGKGASSVAKSNILSDYASIKNGSYYKLMKAYYKEDNNKSAETLMKDSFTKNESSEKLSRIIQSTDSLKESADQFMSLDDYADFETMEDNINQFVQNYNSVIKATKDSNINSIAQRSSNLIFATNAHAKSLEKVGITIEDDFTLSFNSEKYKNATPSTLNSLFTGHDSYSYRVSTQASFINFSADHELSKATTYTTNGTYNQNNTYGNLFNRYF